MIDPYKRDTPGMADPANNVYLLTPDDDNDIPVGIKALRIFNPNEFTAYIYVVTIKGKSIGLPIPALCLWTEPLRIKRLLTDTTSGLVIHGYTDSEAEDGV